MLKTKFSKNYAKNLVLRKIINKYLISTSKRVTGHLEFKTEQKEEIIENLTEK